jgi:hypothetical protein
VDAVEAIVARYQAPDFRIDLGGTPILVETLQGAIQADMIRFTLIAIIAIAAFLFLLFRRAGAVVLPLVVVILSLLCTLSIMAIAGAPIQIPTQILPSFLLAVGVGNSVHVFAIFFQRRRVGDDKEQAISFALGHSGLAIVAELAPIAQFGIWAPVGVMIALVLTVVLLPALIAVFPMGAAPPAQEPRLQATQRLLVRTGTFATDHASAIVLASAGLLAIALLGAFQLRFSHYPVEWFPEGHFFRVSTVRIDHELKGSMFLEILIDSGRENGLHEPALLDRVDEMRRHTTRLQMRDVYVGKTVSLVDVVKEIHQALNENRPDFHAVPRDRTLVAQELLLFENSGSDDLEDVVDPQFRVGRFTMKVPFVDAIQYDAFLDAIDRDFREILGEGVEITITGLMALVGRTMNAVIHSMAKTYVVAFLVITPLMVLLIGNLRIGLLSMVPNLTPILITLGVMGWFEIPLDAFTLLIGSIAIGLAVEPDPVHGLLSLHAGVDARDVLFRAPDRIHYHRRVPGRRDPRSGADGAGGAPEDCPNSRHGDVSMRRSTAAGLFAGAVAILPAAPAATAELTGREIMERVDERDDGDNATQDMEMILIDKNQNQRVREIRSFRRDQGEDTHSILFFLSPADVKDTGFLTYDYDDADKDDDQWLYLPALKKTKRIASSDKSGSFMGSDFSYADLTTRELDHYDYTLLKEGEVGSHKTEDEIDETGYTKSIFFVRQDNDVVIRSKNWVKKGSREKYFDVRQLERIDGIWVATEMHMATKKGKRTLHQTVIRASNVRFNQELAESQFTVRQLEKGL